MCGQLRQSPFRVSTEPLCDKAKNIKATSEILLEKHGGEVPSSMEELVALPGVGRKTANVVRGVGFDIPSLVVDTHVTRISNMLGLTSSKNAEIIEREICHEDIPL